MRPYINYTDEELVAEITTHFEAKSKIAMGGIYSKIAGEGRLVEFSPGQAPLLDQTLRYLEFEARQRGLEIAGEGGAISLEFR